MNYAVIDIETVPVEIKDDDIKEYLMDKQISKEMRAFHPLFSKIICICLKNENNTIALTGNEKEILEKFWDTVQDYNYFITFNGYSFDIPFIIIRSTVNKVKFRNIISLNKFNMQGSNHFDVMLYFSQNTFTNIRLDIIAKSLGIMTGEDRFTGREVERLYKEGNIDEIIEHCKQDVSITEKIWMHVKNELL